MAYIALAVALIYVIGRLQNITYLDFPIIFLNSLHIINYFFSISFVQRCFSKFFTSTTAALLLSIIHEDSVGSTKAPFIITTCIAAILSTTNTWGSLEKGPMGSHNQIWDFSLSCYLILFCLDGDLFIGCTNIVIIFMLWAHFPHAS